MHNKIQYRKMFSGILKSLYSMTSLEARQMSIYIRNFYYYFWYEIRAFKLSICCLHSEIMQWIMWYTTLQTSIFIVPPFQKFHYLDENTFFKYRSFPYLLTFGFFKTWRTKEIKMTRPSYTAQELNQEAENNRKSKL